MKSKKNKKEEAWVVAVDMGYGHQRAAYPLRMLSPNNHVVIANNYKGIPKRDYNIWKYSRKIYESFSRLNNIPGIGRRLFSIFDKLQGIPPFYPYRDLSKSSSQVDQVYWLISKGWGKHLVEYLNTKDIPMITTFFNIAFIAEEHGFKNDIYLVICDADMSRAWVARDPKKSRIKYFASCRRVKARLKLYGVPDKNIFLTGFPLPDENLGGSDVNIVKKDLAERIINLDPQKRYREKYSKTIKQFLGKNIRINAKHAHPLTLSFAVGGAGAQAQLGRQIMQSLSKKIKKGELNMNLVAGSRPDVYQYFMETLKQVKLQKYLDKNIHIIYDDDKETYFKKFNIMLRTTDILWTKPSELSFYTALGLPIIMAPTIGAQEEFNRDWLIGVGGGLDQLDPEYTDEWLFDWVNSGWLAEAAMSGFLDGRQFGVSNIKKVIFEGEKEPAKEYQLL